MKKPLNLVLIFVAVSLWTASILPGCGNTHIDDELKKDGIKALGRIIEGIGKSGQYSEYFDVTIAFQDENGTDLTVHKSVTRSEFDSFSKDQKVLMVYSKKNPSIVKILSTPEEVQEYTGIKERSMAIADLNALVTMKKENVYSFLNSITYKWEKKDNDSAWINERKSQYVRLFPSQKSVVYISGSDEYKRFQDLVKQAGFHETEPEVKGESERKTFENDSLFIGLILNRETVARTGTDIMSLVQGDREVELCSVTLRKKTPATINQ